MTITPRKACYYIPLILILILLLGAFAPPGSLHAQTITRGPYLQNGNTSAVSVRWRTSTATGSVVRYGVTAGSLAYTVSVPGTRSEHEVRLTGLAADTRYFYSVGNAAGPIAEESTCFFVTAPAGARPTRVWVIGDAGTGSGAQAQVRDAYAAFTGARPTDLWLMLGDNAYNNGTDSDYQSNLFNVYRTMLRQSVLWCTYGNHDGQSADSSSQSGPYYDMHSFPRSGESGGVASGTEAYYSWDYGNIHFISLDSYESGRSSTGTQANWLRSDLDANTKDWTIVFWHHPPYSRGSHNSDTEVELIDMRLNFVPILEAYGVDLVLCGHSHAYERSKFIDGHYGPSGTFSDATMVKQTGSGRADSSSAYTKSGPGQIPHSGAVYVVDSTLGQASGGTLNHPAMYLSLNVPGSVVLDIDGTRLDFKYLDNKGAVRDYFTLDKSTVPNRAPSATTVPVPVNYSVQKPGRGGVPATVSFQDGVNGYAGTNDTKIRASNRTTNYGAADTLEFDGDPDTASLIRWDLTSIPAGRIITAVTLTFNVTNSSAGTYEFYALKRSWEESSATWNRAAAGSNWQITGANGANDRDSVPLGSISSITTGLKSVTLNASGIATVQSWVTNPASNFGFVILDYTVSDGLDVSSRESATVTNRPKITITLQ